MCLESMISSVFYFYCGICLLSFLTGCNVGPSVRHKSNTRCDDISRELLYSKEILSVDEKCEIISDLLESDNNNRWLIFFLNNPDILMYGFPGDDGEAEIDQSYEEVHLPILIYFIEHVSVVETDTALLLSLTNYLSDERTGRFSDTNNLIVYKTYSSGITIPVRDVALKKLKEVYNNIDCSYDVICWREHIWAQL